jgi:hypothetical protein
VTLGFPSQVAQVEASIPQMSCIHEMVLGGRGYGDAYGLVSFVRDVEVVLALAAAATTNRNGTQSFGADWRALNRLRRVFPGVVWSLARSAGVTSSIDTLPGECFLFPHASLPPRESIPMTATQLKAMNVVQELRESHLKSTEEAGAATGDPSMADTFLFPPLLQLHHYFTRRSDKDATNQLLEHPTDLFTLGWRVQHCDGCRAMDDAAMFEFIKDELDEIVDHIVMCFGPNDTRSRQGCEIRAALIRVAKRHGLR